jgi:hypothetical protein
MIRSLLLHPATTFFAGFAVALGGLSLLLASCAAPNRSAATLDAYKRAMHKAGSSGPAAGSAEEKAAVARFGAFLQNIHDAEFVRTHTALTYAPDAYLNDTLVTHHGVAEIQAYFLQTSAAMTRYEVTIDDVARSGPDLYVRWTMVFSAPALSDGEAVHSTGISQVRFDSNGLVAFHQDFWDSGTNFFGQAPVAGNVIEFIRRRLK